MLPPTFLALTQFRLLHDIRRREGGREREICRFIPFIILLLLLLVTTVRDISCETVREMLESELLAVYVIIDN